MEALIKNALEKLPLVKRWVADTLERHTATARPVCAFGFARLPLFFAASFLDHAKVVAVQEQPKLPIEEMGLPEFLDFTAMPSAAITYHNTYFMDPKRIGSESLHFHELVHVVQWLHLGIEQFLIVYALGLLTQGYENSPLEAQAFAHQRRFDQGEAHYNVKVEVERELAALFPDRIDEAWIKRMINAEDRES